MAVLHWLWVLILAVFSVGGIVPSQTSSAQATPSPTPEPCEYVWFFEEDFANIAPPSCPEAEETQTEVAFQQFQYGYMLWTQSDDMIYVMHQTTADPMIETFLDPYVEGEPERDHSWDEPQPPQTIQPRFGFGAVWREQDELRRRIGWAIQGWESVYTGRLQVAVDGTIYIEEASGGVFVLLPEDWMLYR